MPISVAARLSASVAGGHSGAPGKAFDVRDTPSQTSVNSDWFDDSFGLKTGPRSQCLRLSVEVVRGGSCIYGRTTDQIERQKSRLHGNLLLTTDEKKPARGGSKEKAGIISDTGFGRKKTRTRRASIALVRKTQHYEIIITHGSREKNSFLCFFVVSC